MEINNKFMWIAFMVLVFMVTVYAIVKYPANYKVIEHNNTVYVDRNITHTIYMNNTIIREIITQCENITKLVYINHTIYDNKCPSALNNCNYDLKKMYSNYVGCLVENNTKQVENLTSKYLSMKKSYQNCSAYLNNITKVFQGYWVK